MSKLSLRIDKYLEFQRSASPKVYASIYSIDPSSGKSEGKPMEKLVPLSKDKSDTTIIDLKAGHYYIEASLPSGEMVSSAISLGENEESSLTLHPKSSPHEWLSWQKLMGNSDIESSEVESYEQPIPMEANEAPLEADEAPLEAGGEFEDAGGESGGLRANRRPYAREEPLPPTEPRAIFIQPTQAVLPFPKISLLTSPAPELGDPQPQQNVWKYLCDLQSKPSMELLNALNMNHSGTDISPYNQDDTRAVFRFGPQSPNFQLPPGKRNYAALVNDHLELVSLPLPWRVLSDYREAEIEIAINKLTPRNEFQASMGVLDEQLGVLLGYLATGSLPDVRRFAEEAKEMLYEKFANPLGAAAGGYALVGTASKVSTQDWHQWVKRLCDSFSHIPDGAILWGQLRLRLRTSKNDSEVAKESFKNAFKRGIPFYSMGIKWLLDGLDWFSDEDSEAKEMALWVRQIAWRTNFKQAFSIIRLGPK